MKTKKIIIGVIIAAFIAGGAVFFVMFGFYSTKQADGTTDHIFVRKTKSLNIGDLVAYRYPLKFDTKISDREIYVSRVVAMPGEIVLIDDAVLYRTGRVAVENYPTYMRYRASIDEESEKIDFEAVLSKYDVRFERVLNDGKSCEFVCSNSEFEKITTQENCFSSCRMILERDDKKDTEIFPSSAFYAWNKDNFGPIYVPEVGDTLNFTPRVAPMYKNIITYFEGNDFQSDTYHVRINGQEAHEYVTTKKYYFILNDDRTQILDSRSYGPIAEEYIIGKVVF